MTAQRFRVELDEQGVLHLAGLAGAQDPVCPECRERIRLVMDVTSFVLGSDHRLVHARCLWRPEVLAEQALLSAVMIGELDGPPARSRSRAPARRSRRVTVRARSVTVAGAETSPGHSP